MPFKNWKMQPHWYRTVVIALLSVLSLGSIGVWMKVGRMLENYESRMFTDSRVRDRAEALLLELSDTSSTKSRLIRHVTDPNIHMSRNAKDSTYVTRVEFEALLQDKAIDEYNTMRAFTLHESRQEETNNRLLRSQSIILEKIDQLQRQLDRMSLEKR